MRVIVFLLFLMGLAVLLMETALEGRGNSSPEVQILPKEVTSQPFDFSITIKSQPDLSALSSFGILVNGTDITFPLIIAALKTPGLVFFPDLATLRFALPQISLPPGTFIVDVSATSSTGEKVSDSVTYTIPRALISFTQSVKPIFDSRCAIPGCHFGPNPEQGLNLATPYDPRVGAVGIASRQVPTMLRIKPGDPDNSYLVHKIQGTQAQVGGLGRRMPLTGPPFLTDEQIHTIKEWIRQGALNN